MRLFVVFFAIVPIQSSKIKAYIRLCPLHPLPQQNQLRHYARNHATDRTMSRANHQGTDRQESSEQRWVAPGCSLDSLNSRKSDFQWHGDYLSVPDPIAPFGGVPLFGGFCASGPV